MSSTMENSPVGCGPVVLLLLLLGNNLNFSMSYYYMGKSSTESEREQESNLINPGMALLPGSALLSEL